MYQPKNTKFMTYHIPYVKSYDPQFPGSNLLEISSQPQGWQSARFCSYPQELILQFQSSVTINKLQILAHEKKIPTKVEVFIGRSVGKLGYENVQFKRIGYFTFHSNHQSNYQARELKTVSIDENDCNLLKLLIHKNHENKFNPFNQVGIIAIRVFGNKPDLPPAQKTKNRANLQVQDEVQAAAQGEKALEPKIMAHILALEHQKEYCIQHEDYQEAKQLKARIQQFKEYGQQLKELEDKKKMALQTEDYDLATQLKEEIKQIKIESGIMDEYGNDVRPNINQIRKQEIQEEQEVLQQKTHNESKLIQDDSYEFNKQAAVPQEVLGGLNDKTDIQNQTQMQDQTNNQYDQDISMRKKPLNYDEMVIPALINKNKGQELDEFQDPEKEKQSKELSREQMKKAEPLIPYFGLEFCQKFFSANWRDREDSLKWLIEQLKNPTQIDIKNPDGAFQAGLYVVYRSIQDKAAQVAFNSLVLLEELLSTLKAKSLGDESPIILDNITLILMDKLGEINERSKEECKKILLALAESQVMGTIGVINHLSKGITTKPNLQISSTRHIQARLLLVYQLIQKYQINNDKIPYNQVMELAIRYLDHQAEQVRTNAIYIITEAYKFQSEKVRDSLRGVRQAQMQILEELFYKIDNGGNIQGSFDHDKQMQKYKQKQKQQTQQYNQVNLTTTCVFCGMEDKEFFQSQKLDNHLWQDCVMLTTCPSCAQVIEVKSLNNHLLDECEFSKDYRQCEICGTSIHYQKLEEHQEVKQCNQNNTQETCPLCFQAVGGDWKVHLAICSKQEKNRQENKDKQQK